MVKTDQKENFDLVIFDQPLPQVHPKLSKKLQYSVGDFEALFVHILTKSLILIKSLRIVEIQAILFLKSMSERLGSDIQRL